MQFHTQFFRAELEVCIVELSRVTQRNGETTDLFISRFKKMRNRCKIHLLETEHVKMAQRGLDIELRKKKIQGMEFRDFYKRAAKETEYEELLKEESYRRKKSMGTYCQKVNKEVAMADLSTIRTFTCPLLVEKTPCNAPKIPKNFYNKKLVYIPGVIEPTRVFFWELLDEY